MTILRLMAGYIDTDSHYSRPYIFSSLCCWLTGLWASSIPHY